MSLARNHPAEAREYLRRRDGDYCWLCGKFLDPSLSPRDPLGTTIEHVIPRAAGGTHHLDNLRLSHNRCNHARGASHEGRDYEGRDYGRQPSPYGIGKHYRRRRQCRYGEGAPYGDWDTPVAACWPVDPVFESWSAART